MKKFIFPFYKKTISKELIIRLNNAGLRLESKLRHANLDTLPVSDYNKKYLRKYIRKLRPSFQKYIYILLSAIDGLDKPLDKIVLIDFGGGSGLLSFLAKEAGVGTVLYNDIFQTSCDDVRILAETFALDLEGYICGDIFSIRQYLETQHLQPDIFLSCDVMEHIYNLDHFFSLIYQLPTPSLNMVMSTHANPWNPVINRSLMNQQRRAELTDRTAEWGHKERDSLQSFMKIRAGMIRHHASQLTDSEIRILAERTRGQKEDDIIQTVERYVKTGIMPVLPAHPTNTCDPTNGNGADNLMPPPEYKRLLQNNGFEARLLNGFYGHPQPLIRRMIARLLDFGIFILGNKGSRLSSYFIVIGTKKITAPS